MGIVSVTTIIEETETINRTKLNGLAGNLVTEFNGNIDNANIKANANISATKLDLSTVAQNVEFTGDVEVPTPTENEHAANKEYADTKIAISSKAIGTDINTGTDDDKYTTSKAIADSNVLRSEKDGQIAALTEKTTPHDDDLVLIEDSEASNAKKKMKQSNLVPVASNYQVFAANGTWVNPGKGTMVIVEAWGGGGGGAQLLGGVVLRHRGGGGGGSYARRELLLADLAGADVSVVVGAGGVGGASNGHRGNYGGNSSFGTHVYAYGGCGGATASNSHDGQSSNDGGGGGGTLSRAIGVSGGTYDGGNGGVASSNTAPENGGLYSGAGGGTSGSGNFGSGDCLNGADAVFGGAGGAAQRGSNNNTSSIRGISRYGGNGGNAVDTRHGEIPGGGGGGCTHHQGNGARGEVRVWTV